MSDWITVAREGEIAPGEWRVVDVDGTQVLVFNLEGEHYALEDLCTHDGGVLSVGGKLEGDQIVCARHGAHFCIRTGAAMSAPAYEPTQTFPVKVEDGYVKVRDVRWD